MVGYMWKVLFGVFLSLTGFYVWGTSLRKEGPHFSASNSPALQWNLKVIAHRGGSHEGPENVIETFEALHREIPEMVLEADVQLTRDEELVVIHDDTVDRTTDGQGRVDEKTLAELQVLDAAYHWKDSNGQTSMRGKGLRIPLLKNLLARVPGGRWILEVKDKRLATPDKFREIIKTMNLQEQVIIASQYGQIIKSIRHYQPQWAFGAPYDEVLKTLLMVRLNLWGLDPMPSDFFIVPEKTERADVVTPEFLEVMKKKNKRVVVWTINDVAEAERLWAMGADGVITDEPRALWKALNR